MTIKAIEKRIKTLERYAEIIKKKTNPVNLLVIVQIIAAFDSWEKHKEDGLDDYYIDMIDKLSANLK